MAEAQLQRGGFSDREVRRILDRAARLQQRAGSGTEPGILRESAEEAGIPREFIDRAIEELRSEREGSAQTRKAAVAVVVGLLLFVGLALATAYNSLNSRLVAVQQARAQLENVLQRRYDLIPNLVAVAREYSGHESQVFTALAQARTRYAQANTLQEKEAVERDVSATLPRFYVVVESYPELRSSEVYTRLQDELAGTENRIAVERQRYNQAVAEYNQAARSFPLSVSRRLLGMPASQPFFEAQPAAHEAPRL